MFVAFSVIFKNLVLYRAVSQFLTMCMLDLVMSQISNSFLLTDSILRINFVSAYQNGSD
jgi:hypothetical protein